MTANPTTIEPTATAQEAAQIMKSEDIGSLPIVEGDKLVGVITDRDMAIRVVAEGRGDGHRSERDRVEGRRHGRSAAGQASKGGVEECRASLRDVKNEKQYEALKDKGMSKERAAKIANSPDASKHGGQKSHSGSGNSSQGGTTAQKKAAGRKGGKATARKS